jgi:hypothetical protein
LPVDDKKRRVRCPNCGATVPVAWAPEIAPTGPAAALAIPQSTGDGVALAALIVSLLFFIPFLCQLTAVILGLVALFRPRDPGQSRGTALATVAIVLSVVVCTIWIGIFAGIARARSTGGTGAAGAYGYSGYGAGFDEAAMEQAAALKTCMEALAPAVRGYVRDYGAWPEDLDVLVPVYLNRHHLNTVLTNTKEGGTWVRWIGGIDPNAVSADRVIAYSLVVRHDDSGMALDEPKRWVLLYSGRLELLTAKAFETAIQTGIGPPIEVEVETPPPSPSG